MRGLLVSSAIAGFLATMGPSHALQIVAAGDVAVCSDLTPAKAVGALIETLEGPVLALGDLAYDNGTPREFQNCYDPAWGSFKSRTFPTPGNHEYHTRGAAGYYAHF